MLSCEVSFSERSLTKSAYCYGPNSLRLAKIFVGKELIRQTRQMTPKMRDWKSAAFAESPLHEPWHAWATASQGSQTSVVFFGVLLRVWRTKLRLRRSRAGSSVVQEEKEHPPSRPYGAAGEQEQEREPSQSYCLAGEHE